MSIIPTFFFYFSAFIHYLFIYSFLTFQLAFLFCISFLSLLPKSLFNLTLTILLTHCLNFPLSNFLTSFIYFVPFHFYSFVLCFSPSSFVPMFQLDCLIF